MSFIVEQKVGKNTYLYEAESYWDPEKKQPRQKRKYLGKKDPQSGEVIPPRRRSTPRFARDFGHVFVLRQLAEEVGLARCLEEGFGADGEQILALAIYLAAEGRPFYLFESWLSSTALEGAAAMSSQALSGFLAELGRSDGGRVRFTEAWVRSVGEAEGIIFDITSISSYGEGLSFLEWGYNRDSEKLRQVNLAVVAAYPSALPLFYRLYPGSLADVSTLVNLARELGAFGVQRGLLVLDRGFFSAGNLAELEGSGLRFVMPLPASTALFGRLLSGSRGELGSPSSGFLFEGRPLFWVARGARIGEVPIRAHLYLDEVRRGNELGRFYERLLRLEELVSGREFGSREEVLGFLEARFAGSSKLYAVGLEGRAARLERRDKAISRRTNRFGRSVLLSNAPSLERESVLEIYRSKDLVEKIFASLKHEVDGKRLRAHGLDVVEGRLFVQLLALIILCRLRCRMRESGLRKTHTVAEILMELKKVRKVRMADGRTYITELTRRQKDILNALGVTLPET